MFHFLNENLSFCWKIEIDFMKYCSYVYKMHGSHLNTLRTGLLNCLNARSRGLTFRHVRPVYMDRCFATLQRTLFIYLINKYISLSDICLTVHH